MFKRNTKPNPARGHAVTGIGEAARKGYSPTAEPYVRPGTLEEAPIGMGVPYGSEDEPDGMNEPYRPDDDPYTWDNDPEATVDSRWLEGPS